MDKLSPFLHVSVAYIHRYDFTSHVSRRTTTHKGSVSDFKAPEGYCNGRLRQGSTQPLTCRRARRFPVDHWILSATKNVYFCDGTQLLKRPIETSSTRPLTCCSGRRLPVTRSGALRELQYNWPAHDRQHVMTSQVVIP